MRSLCLRCLLSLLLLLVVQAPAQAYSVLTHEAIIDAVWDKSMRPYLKLRFPDASDEQLRAAHAMAYGGALMPDMGYYPKGSKFFTNLVHYVRSGEFVQALLREARTLDELAFALGALSHYHADRYGHPLGTNRCVPLIYPHTQKWGRSVNYEEDPLAHKRVEFGFDVLQTARGNYAPQAYHDFIGFRFADSLVQRCFRQTYGLPLNDVFSDFQGAINMLRFCVRDLFPVITKAAWHSRAKEIREHNPGATARSFRYRMQRKRFNQLYERKEDRPRFFTRLLGNFISILPKIGPLKPLRFRVPDQEAEKIFVQSFDTVTFHLQAAIAVMKGSKLPELPNYDFDTGRKTAPGEYGFADETYQCLLVNLKKDGFANLDSRLRSNILRFYETADSGSSAQYPAAVLVQELKAMR